jgi:hypothetical protein
VPHHWRPIDPDNPNRKARGDDVKQKARAKGGDVKFVGSKKGTNDWFMLVDVTGVADPEALARDCKSRGPATVYYTSDEQPA